MENLEIQKPIQKTYYIHANEISRLEELIKLMPNYATVKTNNFTIVDYFYETPDRLLEQLDASIRVRVCGDKQTLSIVCKNNGERREFETEMHYGDKIENNYILFLEDKLQDIYINKMDADIARMLKSLKIFMHITTERKQLEIINNSGFKGFVNIDYVLFTTKRHNVPDNILELKMDCVNDVANKTAFERMVFLLEQKLSLVPMDETKYEAGKRVFRFEY